MAMMRTTDVGPLRHADLLRLTTGGSESNVGIGLSRLGLRVRWIGRVGRDELGERVVRDIRAEGVEVIAIRDEEAPTGLMIKEQRTRDQIRVSYYRRASAGSRLDPSDLPTGTIERSRLLHVTGITPALSGSAHAAVNAAVSRARHVGVPVSLDLNHRRTLWSDDAFRAAVRPLVEQADVVFGSPEEVGAVLGEDSLPAEELARRLRSLGPAQCVIKCGSDGAVALIDDALFSQQAFDVPVIDSVGAGDAFVAGYLFELLEQPDDHGARLRTAAWCGAQACTVPGDWEGAPSRSELDSSSDVAVDDVLR
jgi:2-dehydro-3-deoxygluconokinase